MTDYVVRDTQLTSVADAIRAKGGTSAPLAFPDGFVDAVDAIPTGGGGGGSVPAKEVNFRDYDGTVVYSYTPAEFAALSAMPANPDHSGDEIPLTAQGWNWSFADAQAYVAKYGRLEVGQMYATTDGKTHVLIHLEQGRTSPILGCCPSGTVDVDWGDGTAHDTLTGTSVTVVQWTPTHEYAAPGDYDIKLTCTGTMGFYGSSSSNQYSGLLRYSSSADIRNRVYQGAILAVYCAETVRHYVANSFYYCEKMRAITCPNNGAHFFNAQVFNQCHSLVHITIPIGFTSIGEQAFANCRNLESVSLPNTVTSIGNAIFNGASNIYAISFPDSFTEFGFFLGCNSLTIIIIPESVTKLRYASVNNCGGVAEIHLYSTTPPTADSGSAFSNLPTDCKIYVPAGSLEAYTSATNYPSASTYTYIEEA